MDCCIMTVNITCSTNIIRMNATGGICIGGHAVSNDLIHWEELPIALYPDEHGTVFSGSAVVDYDNTSGFGKNGIPAMVAIYTADNPEKQVQCIAYSLDKGRTWTKYKGQSGDRF